MAEMQAAEKEKLWSIVREIPVALLTTDDDGTLRSRPMAACQSSFDGHLWFFTRASSHKSIEIGKNYHVNVSYAVPEEDNYVSISGLTEIVRDPGKQRELWNDEIARWIGTGPEDEDVALLKVIVQQAEYWQAPQSRSGDTQHATLDFKRPRRRPN